MFNSRITGTASALGLTCKTARNAAALQELARKQPPECVIVDLSNPGLQIAELMQFLRENSTPAPFVVAYGSHVDTATLQAARAAGCDLVLPRSKFVQELPEKLPEWFAARESR
jgi:CheY-like chemotaxis protein